LQFVTSNYIDYSLTDVFASLGSLIVTLGFLKLWRPAPDPEYAIRRPKEAVAVSEASAWQGWLPWLIVAAVVIVWTWLKVFAIGQISVPWPGLDKAISITLYDNKPYAAVWVFQPLATGTGILVAALITAGVCGLDFDGFVVSLTRTAKQIWLAVVTVCFIVGLAFLMNYSGLAYTLGKGVASVGAVFVILSPFLGWVAVFLSGSDTSGNALFGNLQVVASKQLGFNPVLFAAANSSGGVMGKMISPQNIATGVSVTELKGREGEVFARTFPHSVILTLIFGLLVALQQYVIPWIIPAVPGQ
jgi:lactate permease